MTATAEIHLLIPGPLEQRTGGYLYDARMVEGLSRLGWSAVVHSLEGQFPDPDEEARSSARRSLVSLPEGAAVLVDSLSLPALPPSPDAHVARLRIIPLIHHLASEEVGFNKFVIKRLEMLEKESLSQASGVIVTSDHTANRVERLGVAGHLIHVVHPGVEPARMARGPEPGSPPQLLCVGSVIPRKGQDVLVHALAQLDDRRWTCICAGSLERATHFAERVFRIVDETGLAERVRFVGECDEARLEEFYDRSSIFVLPSHYEGYGMALTEALARGLPVVSTIGGAIPHTVPAEAGLLVPPGDPAALAQALATLLPNEPRPADTSPNSGKDRWTQLASAARRHAATLPSWDDQARAFAEAILSITEGGGALSER